MNQERSSEMCTPRNLKDETLSTHSAFRWSGAWAVLFRLKSMMISLVFVVFNSKLFDEHQYDSCWTSSLYSVSSPPEIRPTTVVSSANFMIRLEG
jgi:hypothetical protein